MRRLLLFWELSWAHLLLWIAGSGRSAEAKPEVHLYLADLHFRLADEYQRLRRPVLARRHRKIANAHVVSGPPDREPPRAAAAAMMIPQPPIFTDARGTWVPDPPDDAA